MQYDSLASAAEKSRAHAWTLTSKLQARCMQKVVAPTTVRGVQAQLLYVSTWF